MKKVFQTIVDPDHGNCMQAAIASLFELKLEDVPNFIEMGDEWWDEMVKLYNQKGFDYFTSFNINRDKRTYEEKCRILEYDNGINGYFYASVPSQSFDDVTHAVIVDTKMNIVHDPNPNQKALKLKPEDIITINTVRHDWHIDVDGNFVIDKVK